MITGGGHVPAETLELLNDVGYPLYNGFGMTECGIISVELSLDPEQRKKGSIGIPFPPNEYRLTAPGVGELQLRGDALYTASIVDGVIVPRDREMWFSTGDLVRQEADGLYIVGRSKDVIINASGENIYPDELEDGFADLPGVTQFSILGLREKGYEVVTLVIVPSAKFDAEVLQEAVKQVNAGLNPNERVLRLLVSKQALPMSGSMKVQRGKLREGLESGTWPVAALWGNEKSVETPKAVSAGSNNELDSIKVSLRRIIADNLSIDENTIGDNDDFQRDLGGDSLTLVGASIEIGERFDLVLTDEEIREMTSINAAAAVLCRRLYGYGGEKVRQQPKAARRITNFRDSEEYMALKARIDDTFRDGTPNPYFLPHDSLIRDTSIIHGQQVVNLGSYNYLGMSGHPETMAAAIEAIRKYGTSASGSRTLAGEKTLYQELERSIADWKHSEAAIVCTGGWATNLTFIASFMKEGDFILYDALSHNSIADGVALSKAESRALPHNDLNALERLLQKLEGHYSKVLIVVEGVYSMDGDIAPIPEFVRLKEQYGCFLMVDEAHSGGVLGEWGGGVEEYFHLDPRDIDIKYGTMSKALGTCGGFIAADASIIEYLRYSMDGFVFTAGIAPPLAAACMKAIELIRRDNKAVTQLHKNIAYFVRRCKDEGMNTCLAGESAIVPILIGTDKDAARLSAELLQEGIFIPPAMYPAVPMGESRLRVTISATHTEEQLEHAVSALSAIMRREGFLPTKG